MEISLSSEKHIAPVNEWLQQVNCFPISNLYAKGMSILPYKQHWQAIISKILNGLEN